MLCRSLKRERCKDVTQETTEKEIFSVHTQFNKAFADKAWLIDKVAPKKKKQMGGA